MGRRQRDIPALFDAARSGHRASLAKLLSAIERGGDSAREVGALAFPVAGTGYTVGITGAPGAGKSTLTSALVAEMRSDESVLSASNIAVLAIDPSSPFTGGAILGDRVRMQDHALDESVFIRSMATRGHLGGLALAAPEAVRVLEAAGRDWVLIETVGVGQVEVEVVGAADTTVVVVNPGWGDAVQANKAGLMEIADVFVINKADRAGTADTHRDLEHMLDLSAHPAEGEPYWRPPIVETVANTNTGLEALAEAIGAHRAHITESGILAKRRDQRVDDELRRIIVATLEHRAGVLSEGKTFDAVRAEVAGRRLDPWQAARQLIEG